MGLFDKAKSIFSSSNESEESAESKLGKVTEKDHLNSIIKEREDLCRQLFESETSETVKRDGKLDITFKGWQICNVEERHNKDDRRLGYLKLFRTSKGKFVCQRMTLIDSEEKHYSAATVEDFVGIKNFFGEDKLAQALYTMLDRVSSKWS